MTGKRKIADFSQKEPLLQFPFLPPHIHKRDRDNSKCFEKVINYPTEKEEVIPS